MEKQFFSGIYNVKNSNKQDAIILKLLSTGLAQRKILKCSSDQQDLAPTLGRNVPFTTFV